jgi:hypothetical protein
MKHSEPSSKLYLHLTSLFMKFTCSRFSDWLRAGRPRGWSLSPCRDKFILHSTSPRPGLRSTQPPIQWVLGVKRPGRETDYSPLTSAEVKIVYISTL